jgi:hypothetical protein
VEVKVIQPESEISLWVPRVSQCIGVVSTHIDISEASVAEEEDVTQERAGIMIVSNKTPAQLGFNDDPRHYNANIKDDIALSTSHATSANFSGLMHPYNTFNQSSQVLFSNTQIFAGIAQSADTFLTSQIFARMQARPKALTNPFAPATIRIRMDPGRRRWAHTFPYGKADGLFASFIETRL